MNSFDRLHKKHVFWAAKGIIDYPIKGEGEENSSELAKACLSIFCAIASQLCRNVEQR